MKKYVKADWDDSKYVRIGNLMLPLDASGYGNQSGEEISRQVKRAYQDELDEQEAKRLAAEESRLLAERLKRETELSKINYEKAFADVDYSADGEKQLDSVFKAMVPRSGKCDNLGGELARAMMKILYRDWNDGDVFYDGYGLETCVAPAAFIIDYTTGDEGDTIYDLFMEIAGNALTGVEYTNKLQDIASVLLDFLKNNPEVFGKEPEDSISYKSETIDAIKYEVPKESYEVDLSGDLERYIENGCISYDDEIYEWLKDMCYEYGGELYQRALDWFEITDLSPEELSNWENNFPDRIISYLDYLEEEYPNYGEEEDYDEDFEDEDEL